MEREHKPRLQDDVRLAEYTAQQTVSGYIVVNPDGAALPLLPMAEGDAQCFARVLNWAMDVRRSQT